MCGGKASGLKTLSAVAPVPPFLVITGATVLDRTNLRAQVDAAGLRGPFAVRSSADTEDGGEAAFAGMFETLLAVDGRDLIDAIQAVRESADSARVRAYTTVRNLELSTMMTVIVQEMVDARVAGVCATRLPESNSNVITIESVWGLGETLVSGTATPDIAYIDRVTERIERGSVGNQVLELRLHDGRRLVSPHLRNVAKLRDAELRHIAEIAIMVEEKTGWAAVDFEWAFDDTQLWALQARPVTSVMGGK